MATTKKQAATKECIVIARYAFKSNKVLNGHVCTLIRNGEGKKYKVWTHANGCASSCDCEGYEKWHRSCYHIKHVEAVEAARKQTATAVSTGVVVTAPQIVNKPVAERKVEANQTKTNKAVIASQEASKKRMDAPLNGAKPFSLPSRYSDSAA